MKKKGAYDIGRKWLYIVIAIFVIIFIFFYMRSAILKFNTDTVYNTERIKGGMIAAQAVMSPKCFAYYDAETERTYPGIIDMDKFNNNNLGKNCMIYASSAYSIRLKGKTVQNIPGAEGKEKIVAPVLAMEGGSLSNEVMEIWVDDYYEEEGKTQPANPPQMGSRVISGALHD